MMTKLAILGVGRWGKHYVRHFLNHPNAEVVAIADPNPDALTTLCQQQSIPDSVLLTHNWQEVKKIQDLAALIVVTPASTHYSLIEDALNTGYHVLAEKPLTLDAAECVKLTELAKQQNLQLFVDHTYLFNSAVKKGQEILKSGELGNLYYGYATRTHIGPIRQDVDALWDLAIHDIAILNEWLGESPHQVAARGNIWLQKHKINLVYPNSQGLADTVWSTLYYPSGFNATLHFCWLNPDKQRRLSVVGSQGTLIFDEMSQSEPLIVQKGHLETQEDKFIPQSLSKQVITFENKEPLKQVCDRFLESIAQNQPYPAASGEKAAELVKILGCLTQSMEKDGELVLI
jgi:predicted dehydrogenase